MNVNLIPRASNNTTASSHEETLGEYLESAEKQLAVPIFSICGFLYIPDTAFNHRPLCHAYKMLIILYSFAFFCGTLSIMVTSFLEEHPPLYEAVLYVSFFLQVFILLPVLTNTRRRMAEPVRPAQKLAFDSSVQVCSVFLIIGFVLWLLYYVLVNVEAYQTLTLETEGRVLLIFTGIAPLAITAISMYALFFIVLDAKVAARDISELLESAQRQTITLQQYEAVYAQQQVVHHDSVVLCDAVAAVAYISMVVFIFSLLVSPSYSTTRTHYGTPNYWSLAAMDAALQFREVFLLLLTLPYMAEVNELNDDLACCLSACEWTIPASSSGAGGAGAGANASTMTVTSTSTSASTTVSSIASADCETATTANSAHLNMRRLSVWAAATDRPLTMRVLGRKVKRVEMKAQLVTFAVIATGALGSFVASGILSSVV